MAPRRRRGSKASRLLSKLAIALVLIAVIVAVRWVKIGKEPEPSSLTTIVRILDGDTMELGNGETVRLLAIDTPEKGEKFYKEAGDLLRRVSEGKEAKLVGSGRARDRYGRLLAYVYIDDTLMVNRVLVDSGMAYVYLFEDTDSRREETAIMIASQRGAIDRAVGLFSIQHKGEKRYIARTGSYRFHRPECSSLDDAYESAKPGKYRTFTTRNEALYEGLSPCRRCKP